MTKKGEADAGSPCDSITGQAESGMTKKEEADCQPDKLPGKLEKVSLSSWCSQLSQKDKLIGISPMKGDLM